MSEPAPTPEVCCPMRKKIVLTPYSLPQDVCGVSDVEVADFLVFDVKSPNGRPVLTFRFCPWCGKPWKLTGQIHEVAPPPDEDSGEDWKQDPEDDEG